LWLRQSLEAAFFTMGSFKLEMRERDSLAPHRQPDPVQGQRRQDPSTVHALPRQDDVLDQQGPIFQTFPSGLTLNGSVNSQAHCGTTHLPAGRYQLFINAQGTWTLTIR
jgi:hypothetical protein